MTCNACGEKPKKTCNDFTKSVIEINNPEQITLMRKVTVPASMGDDTTVPPVVGKYHNVLLYYEANHKSYLYSSDGIPTQLVNGMTDYEAAVNLPQINGNTLIGNKTGDQLDLQNKLTAGDNVTIENNVISATDTTYSDFVGTEGQTVGSAGLVPAPSASDAGKVLGADGTWIQGGPSVVQTTGTSTSDVMSQKAVSDAINNIPEYVVKLTADDYDFPDSSPNSVAIWRLPDGIYYAAPDVDAVRDTYSTMISSAFFIVSHAVGGSASILTVAYDTVQYSYAAANGNPTINPSRLINSSNVSNGLNAVAAGFVLDARQGKVLKDMINATSAATPVITLTATDPGEGATLAENHFIGVYQ